MLLIPKKLYHTIVFLAVYYISMYILCFSVKHLRTTLLNEVLYKSYIIIIIMNSYKMHPAALPPVCPGQSHSYFVPFHA
jgi:hypothetical protein